ncbi:MAG: S9 family peptidase [Acholeplasmataceae bacterium]|jgi:dipeptidyl aminopeptidase/acylaminoacyl peptidase|nr:S9 family peptidase [Acholeplasmataceae bacterium]
MNELRVDHLLDFKYLSNIQTNPSKKRLAFIVSKALLKKNEYAFDLWLSDGMKHKKIISLKSIHHYLFEDDQTLLILYQKNKQEEKRVKEEQMSLYYRYDIENQVLSPAYELPISATIEKVLSPDYLLLKAKLSQKKHELYRIPSEKRKKLIETFKQEERFEDITEIPFYMNGAGFVANQRNQILLYHIPTKTIKPIVDTNFNVGLIKVSDDLKHIYYTGTKMRGIRSLTTHMYVFHMESMTTDVLYDEDDCNMSDFYLLDNKIIIAGSDMKDFGVNQNPDFYLLKNKKLELLTLYRGSLHNSIGSDVRLGVNQQSLVLNKTIYFVSTVDDHSEIHSLSLDGTMKMEFRFNGSIDGIIYVNQHFYAVGLYRQKLQEIYLLNLNENKHLQMTRFNQNVLKNVYVATPKEILVKSKDHSIKGFILYPKEYDEAKKYPTILDIHGGPKTVYGKVYYHEMQYWCNQGYIVIYANPRGSDGKGDEFADIRGKYGTIDYDDLMRFTDGVIEKNPSIDLNNLFVTGGSYGGFMTNWIVGQTDRFKAAVTQRSIANWTSFHATSDIGFYFSKDQTAGHPLTNFSDLYNQSPIAFVNNVKTPLLFIHSDEDYRCPIEQAIQFYVLLKEKGLDTKFIWFKGENHELSRGGKPQARIKRLNEITEWFEIHKNQTLKTF